MEIFAIRADQEVDPLLMGWSELIQRELELDQRELELDQREEKLKRDQIRWMERDRKVGVREEGLESLIRGRLRWLKECEAAVGVREAAVGVREAEVGVRESDVRVRESTVYEREVAVVDRSVLCAPLRSSPLSERNRTDDYYN